ncbi:MAG: peroxide stress protein YaaA [Alphaproteobacteria bacterium]|nr:peroxide stress protein YaaA [Alphaproteobacteria bacterium]
MLVVISPAKRLDFAPVAAKVAVSAPEFQADAVSLSRSARRLSVPKLRKLMSISQDLAKLNQGRFKAFEETPCDEVTKPAVLAFAGDTYIGLEAGTLDADELAYAQDHLRILSGLYGLLRPMDRIQPYRLEMGSRLATRRGKTLYQYWGARLAERLNAVAGETGAKALVNCASVEYFTAVPMDKLAIPVVNPVFLDMQKGEAKIVSFFAKRARGAMARFVMQNRIVAPDALKDFDTGGYVYQPDQSEPMRPVFLRDEPPQPIS